MSHPRKTAILDESIFTVHGLFSPDECGDLLRDAEGLGFEAAPITTGRGFRMVPEVRNNTRVMIDDVTRALDLWDRVRPWIPARRLQFRAVGLNERFRFYRYAPGQYFRWHHDGAFVRDDGEQSFLTLMIYLDDGFEGGSTDFDTVAGSFRVVPEQGMVLVFDHRLLHQGAPVTRGVKHVLRTDVMYRRSPGEGGVRSLP